MSKEHFTHANVTGVTNSPDITYIGLGFASHGAFCTRTVLVTPQLGRQRSKAELKVKISQGFGFADILPIKRKVTRKQDGLPSSPRGLRATPLLAGNGQERGLGQEENTKYPYPNGNGFCPENYQIIRNSADKGSKTMITAPSMVHGVQTVTKAEKGGYEDASLL